MKNFLVKVFWGKPETSEHKGNWQFVFTCQTCGHQRALEHMHEYSCNVVCPKCGEIHSGFRVLIGRKITTFEKAREKYACDRPVKTRWEMKER